MIGKKRNILLICFLSVSIIAILIFVGKLNAGKEIRSEQSTMKAAAVEQVHREVKFLKVLMLHWDVLCIIFQSY